MLGFTFVLHGFLHVAQILCIVVATKVFPVLKALWGRQGPGTFIKGCIFSIGYFWGILFAAVKVLEIFMFGFLFFCACWWNVVTLPMLHHRNTPLIEGWTWEKEYASRTSNPNVVSTMMEEIKSVEKVRSSTTHRKLFCTVKSSGFF